MRPSSTNSEPVTRCPLCGSGDRTELWTLRDTRYDLDGEFPLVRCSSCGLGYLAVRPTPQEVSRYYPEEAYYSFRPHPPHALFQRRDVTAAVWYAIRKSILAFNHGYRHFGGVAAVAALARLPGLGRLRRKATYDLDVLLHPFLEGGKLLEIGCGTGRYLDLMRALGWVDPVGVEMSERAAATARDVLGLRVLVGELDQLALEPASFDAISLSHTLEHLPDPVILLAGVRRLLKPTGRVAVIVPHFEGMLRRLYGQHWHALEVPRHLVHFTEEALRMAVVRAGLRVEALRTLPRGSYDFALFSQSRASGDGREAYVDSSARFPLRRRALARALALVEHVACHSGFALGEELAVVATPS